MSFLVEDLEKPPFFSLLLIPTGSSPSSSLRLSSNIYNPKSKALASLWKASRERDLLFSPHQSRRRCSATESGRRKDRAAPGAPARARRCRSLRRARLTKLQAENAGLSPEGEHRAGPRSSPRSLPAGGPSGAAGPGPAQPLRSEPGRGGPGELGLAPAPTERRRLRRAGTVPSGRARLRPPPPPPPPRPWWPAQGRLRPWWV